MKKQLVLAVGVLVLALAAWTACEPVDPQPDFKIEEAAQADSTIFRVRDGLEL
jgi:hypothetical protein